jgi:hypothetical protein
MQNEPNYDTPLPAGLPCEKSRAGMIGLALAIGQAFARVGGRHMPKIQGAPDLYGLGRGGARRVGAALRGERRTVGEGFSQLFY